MVAACLSSSASVLAIPNPPEEVWNVLKNTVPSGWKVTFTMAGNARRLSGTLRAEELHIRMAYPFGGGVVHWVALVAVAVVWHQRSLRRCLAVARLPRVGREAHQTFDCR